jgi:hypothetical protein
MLWLKRFIARLVRYLMGKPDVVASSPASADAPRKSCHVYARKDELLVISSGEVELSGWNVHRKPVFRLPLDSASNVIGETVLRSLDAHRVGLPDRDESQEGVLSEAGVRSWGLLERTSRCVMIDARGPVATLTAWVPDTGGGLSLAGAGEVQCQTDAETMGATVRRLIDGMPEPAPLKPPRRVQSREGATAGNVSEGSGVATVPSTFGYKTAWWCIPSEDTRAVVAALGLKDARPSGWQDGVAAAYERQGVFVSPPVMGWVFAVGSVPAVDTPSFAPMLRTLSQRFGEAQAFASHRIVGFYSWALAQDGRVVRSYAYLGESGNVLADEGEPTPEERELGIDFSADRVVDGDSPGEEHPMLVAGEWSINPLELDLYESRGEGTFGTMER